MRYCFNCGNEMPDGTVFCSNCGQKDEGGSAQPTPAVSGRNMKFCPRCGTAYNSSERFCAHCGFDLESDPAEAAEAAAAPKPSDAPVQSAGGTASGSNSGEPLFGDETVALDNSYRPAPGGSGGNYYPPDAPSGGNYYPPADPSVGGYYPPASDVSGAGYYPADPVPAPKKGKGKLAALVAILSVVLIAVLVGCYFVITGGISVSGSKNKEVKVDIAEYIDISCGVYDGYGSAEITVDRKKAEDDLKSKIKFRSSLEKGDPFDSFIKDLEALKFTEASDTLRNGDTVEISAGDLEDKYNISVDGGSTVRKTVSGLTQVNTVDIFDNIRIEYNGEDGEAVAYVSFDDSSKNYCSYLELICTPSEGISNGDEVTVRITRRDSSGRKWSTEDEDELCRKCGVRFIKTSETYFVRDLTEDQRSDEYVLPDSDKTRIYASELQQRGFDAEKAQLAINEIYARHGVEFRTPEIQAYFDNQKWYKNQHITSEEVTLSSVENENVKTLKQYINDLKKPNDSGSIVSPDQVFEGFTYFAYITPSDGLKLRTGPGKDYSEILPMGYHSAFIVLGCNSDSTWVCGYYIDVNDNHVSGWCCYQDKGSYYLNLTIIDGSGETGSGYRSDYILYEANTRVYSYSEINSLSDDKLRYALNEICARAGRDYSGSSKYKSYFESKSWYNPTIPSDVFDKGKYADYICNEYELRNIRTIHQIMAERGLN